MAVTSVNLDHLYAKTHEEKSLDNVNDILLGSLREWVSSRAFGTTDVLNFNVFVQTVAS